MKTIIFFLINLAGTLLRGFPIPCKTGLVKIGNPDANAPVFLTSNFLLTVARVKKALRNEDCYLLISNSRGINVWCAAAGGHFTYHDVISSLKTTGIEKLVHHRKLIMPQLAATGIESKTIYEKTGWHILWGPVYAKDISGYLYRNKVKSPEMHIVKFPLLQRIEMAVMWAFPFSVIAGLLTAFLLPGNLLSLLISIWTLSLLIFISFPVYSRWLNPKRKGLGFSKFTVIFNFGKVPLFLWLLSIFIIILISYFSGGDVEANLLRWGLMSLVITLLISIDLMGSTPTYKSGLHEDRNLRIIVNKQECNGCRICESVCPRICFELDRTDKKLIVHTPDLCVQCGACIVQCPKDALFFRSPEGKVITPEIIRKYKLNLMGSRLIEES